MGAKFSGGGATVFHDRTDTPGEIVTELVNSTDGAGLKFDGVAGNIDIVSPPDLGTKFSMEFIVQADAWDATAQRFLVDFGSSGRFIIGQEAGDADLAVYSGGWESFGSPVLDDLKVHHLVVTIDGTSAILYDNANQVGTADITAPTIDLAADARIGSGHDGVSTWFNGTFYRARFWNKTLSQAEVTASFENSTVPFADQYGVQTNKVAAAADQTWSAAQADTGNDVNDRATFEAAYVWGMNLSPIDISIASNVLTFSTDRANSGIYYPSVLTAGKAFRATINVASVTGSAAFKIQYYTGSGYVGVHTLVAGENTVVFTPSATDGGFYITSSAVSAGTLAISAATAATYNQLFRAGCVADYDLAFANPTQSTMVQDRAGAADGTASAGVTQVTPIEQLNAKALSVSDATALAPANGEIIAQKLSVENTNHGEVVVKGASTKMAFIDLKSNAATDAVDITRIAQDDGGPFMIQTTNASINALSITAAGNVGVGRNAPASLLEVHLDTDKNVGFSGSQSEVGNVPALVAYEDAGALASMGFRGVELRFATGSYERLRIDGAGLATFNNGIKIDAGTLQLDDIAESIDFIQAGAINFDSNNDQPGRFFKIGSGRAAGASGGTTHLSIFEDTGVTEIAKVVETGGVLKENLLTNSGFDVWSNSTLCEVTSGAAPVTSGANAALVNNLLTNGGFDSDTSSWTAATATLTSVGSGQTGNMLKVASDEGQAGYAYQDATTVVGKLYYLTYYVDIGTSSTAAVWVGTTGDSDSILGNADTDTTVSTLTNFTHVFEATSTTTRITLVSRDSAGTDYSEFDTVGLYEVTPGCVAANNLAWDGSYVKDTTLDCWRQHDDGGTNTKDGSFYSLKTTTSAASDWFYWPYYYDKLEFVQRFAGRTVTLGCWVKTATASHAEIKIYDSAGNSVSGAHTGGGDWEWLEVTRTVSATTTQFYLNFNLYQSGATAYFSQPMLVFGSAIGEGNYSRPQGEIVNCEAQITIYDDIALLATDDKILNLEALSNGKIPKGCKAISATSLIKNTIVGDDQGVAWGMSASDWRDLRNNPVINGWHHPAAGRVRCDSNGDIYQLVYEADATISYAALKTTAIELR